MIRSPRCDTLITASRQPLAARRSRCQAISGLPATSTSGFGTRSVSGRSRSPRPAARSIAFIARSFLYFVQQAQERRELAIALRHVTRVAEEARRVAEILRLAVAVVDAREDAEHLEVALQAHPFERAPELAEVGVDRETGALRLLPVAHGPVEHALLFPAHERVAHERDHVVSDGADHRV